MSLSTSPVNQTAADGLKTRQHMQIPVGTFQKKSETFVNPSYPYIYQNNMRYAYARNNLITYPDILNKSLDGLLSGRKKSHEIKDLLVAHYFTDVEEQSVWPKAVEETKNTLNLSFTRDELFRMEKAVKAVYRRMLECDFLFQMEPFAKLNKAKKRRRRKLKAKCYLSLHEHIDSGMVDFQFPRGTVEGQARMLQISLAYHVMSLLVLQLAEQMAISAHVTPMKSAIAILDISENLVDSIKSFTKDTIDGRIQAISQIEICEMEVLFWQEFTGECQVRTKRSVTSAEGIGGTVDKLRRRYRAKVMDNVTDKEVCNVALDTNETKDKAQVVFELSKMCTWIRDNYARRVKMEIAEFYAHRTLPVVRELSRLWNNDKKKLKELKDKLKERYSR